MHQKINLLFVHLSASWGLTRGRSRSKYHRLRVGVLQIFYYTMHTINLIHMHAYDFIYIYISWAYKNALYIFYECYHCDHELTGHFRNISCGRERTTVVSSRHFLCFENCRILFNKTQIIHLLRPAFFQPLWDELKSLCFPP